MIYFINCPDAWPQRIILLGYRTILECSEHNTFYYNIILVCSQITNNNDNMHMSCVGRVALGWLYVVNTRFIPGINRETRVRTAVCVFGGNIHVPGR